MNECRIGAVSYLNTKPLVHGMDPVRDGIQLHFDLPGRLADRLAADELDIALIPTIEVLRHPGYRVVSDACIGCRGPVWSVKLLSRCPIGEIRTLALDEGSRTSVALVQILMQHEHGFQPGLRPLPIEADWQSADSDAVVIIGDRAMQSGRHQEFPCQVDLGQWWYDQTGLPFVFAVWTARPGLSAERTQQAARILSRCRDAGLHEAVDLARKHAAYFDLTPEQCEDYFLRYLHFHLGTAERAGMDRFRVLAGDLGLVEKSGELQFHA